MPQTRTDLLERVNEITTLFEEFLLTEFAWKGLKQAKQQQLTTGINKAYGQARGFRHEYLRTIAAENKGRKVITQIYGDVTEGTATEMFAKTTECKNVTKPEKGSVNKVIGDALNQLGSTKKTPRPMDVRVVDVLIVGPENPWPLAGGTYGIDRQASTTDALIAAAKDEVSKLIKAQKPGIQNIRDWLEAQKYPTNVIVEVTSGHGGGNGHSSRPVFPNTGKGPHMLERVRCLTIKVRYDTPYMISDGVLHGHVRGVEEILVQAYWKQGATSYEVKVEKVKIRDSIVGQPVQITRQDGLGVPF